MDLTGKQNFDFCLALSKLTEYENNPEMCHFIQLADLLLKMYKSSFKNTKDETPKWMFDKTRQPIDLPVWEKDMRLVIAKLDDGHKTFQIPVSPKVHSLVHILEVLRTQKHGIGNLLFKKKFFFFSFFS